MDNLGVSRPNNKVLLDNLGVGMKKNSDTEGTIYIFFLLR